MILALFFAVTPFPQAVAQTGTSTSSQNRGTTIGLIGLGVIGLGVVGLSLLNPASQAVSNVGAALSFGGRITSIYPACQNGGIWVLVVQPPPKQPSVIAVIWTPATKTYLAGPPRNIGQQLLGRFDVPYQCVISYTPYSALPGMRMTMVGTSPAI